MRYGRTRPGDMFLSSTGIIDANSYRIFSVNKITSFSCQYSGRHVRVREIINMPCVGIL